MAADVITVHNLTSTTVPLARGIVVQPALSHTFNQRDFVNFPYLADHVAKAVRAKLISAVTAEGEALTPERVLALGRGIHAHTHAPIGGVDPLASGGGMSPADHERLRQLIHFVDDGPGASSLLATFRETLPSGDPFPTSVTWWNSGAKTVKFLEQLITRDADQFPIQEVWNLYDITGTLVVESLTDTITYDGPVEVSRVRAFSP
jgi:hypothetical protein